MAQSHATHARDREIFDIKTHWEAFRAFNKAHPDQAIIFKSRVSAAKGSRKKLIVEREWAAQAYIWYRKVDPTFSCRHAALKKRWCEAWGYETW